MVLELKKQFVLALRGAGIEVTDDGDLEAPFPQVRLSTNGKRTTKYLNTRVTAISFKFDIFSRYAGEKEILELEEKITEVAESMKDDKIMGVEQVSLRIIGDNSKGPVSKHGIITYQFVLSTTPDQEVKKEEEPDDGEQKH